MARAQILIVKRLQKENFDKATLTLKSRVY